MLVKVCHSLVLLQFWWQGCHKGGFGLHPGGGSSLCSLPVVSSLQFVLTLEPGQGVGLEGRTRKGVGSWGWSSRWAARQTPHRRGEVLSRRSP